MMDKYKKEIGMNPNDKELESYFNIQDDPYINWNSIAPSEVNDMINKYKE